MRKKLASLGVICMFVATCLNVQATSQTVGINNVEYHTETEIRQMYNELNLSESVAISFDILPDYTNYTQSGVVSDATLQNALDTLNFVRYIAGLSYDLTLNEQYTQYTQDASFIMGINQTMTHYPTQPSGVSDNLFSSAYKGASSSNISAGRYSLAGDIIYGWMADNSGSNLASVGHRRWILNPTMEATGFGIVKSNGGMYSSYSAMYAFDNTFANTNVSGVIWPAQTMPVEYFYSSYPWSYSAGKTVSDASVKLTKVSSGETWEFSSNYSDDGYFNINNVGYGQTGCIIFQPNGISYSAGDVFEVEISGDVTAKYTVTFMSLTTPLIEEEVEEEVEEQVEEKVEEEVEEEIEEEVEENTYLVDNASSWAKDELKEAIDLGYPVDILPDLYKESITRGDFAYMLGKFLVAEYGEPTEEMTTVFEDLGENPSYAPERNSYIIFINNLGIINGVTPTEFRPDQLITRQEMAVMMLRVIRLTSEPTINQDLTIFSDYSQISSWALESLQYMNQISVINGTSENTISPLGNTTVEQSALICYRYFNK